MNAEPKHLIAKAAAVLCDDGDSIIIGGGSTAFMMAEHLKNRNMQVMTNSFVIAEYLLKNSKNVVNLPAGKVYPDQNLILSPFEEDGTKSFCASKIFFGAQGVGPMGVMETDPQVAQGTSRLMKQAEQRVLLVDSSKFKQRSSLILCPLREINIVITDRNLDAESRELIQEQGCSLIIAEEVIPED
nr:DeoR/GlpR family DNA-binding transcription regulator [Enterovibrio nigricans]